MFTMALRLYNTFDRKVAPFVPADPAHVTFYSCGPTVYDDAHIGNFRAFLGADTLRRWVESPLCVLATVAGGEHAPGAGGRRVTHVMNITDVGHMTEDDAPDATGEDRMQIASRRLLDAKKAGTLPAGVVGLDAADPYAIAGFYAGRFLEDARRLGLKVALEAEADPTLMPRATASVPGMIRVIGRLIERGHAYAVGEAGKQTVYFDVGSFPTYGRLSGNTLEALRTGAGGRVGAENQREKRSPADFLLWKSDPAHLMKWESPWGAGYPGWHIECTAMSAERLAGGIEGLLAGDAGAAGRAGAIIDLHSGGEDNIFPHHECEIAQSCCAFAADPAGGSFARHWFHVRHLMVEGTKMSKSKGNFFTIRDLVAKGHEPGAIRLELIRTHYRSNANFTEQGLRDAARTLERWRKVAEGSGGGDEGRAERETCRAAFASAMDDDLNVAGAIGAVNTWANGAAAPTAADAGLMRTLDGVLGVLALGRLATTSSDIGVFAAGVEPSAAVNARLEERRAARAAKDFARSDAIRDELLAMGYAIKDKAGGKVEVTRA